MEQYILAFITGLTTGGLSCLAVQGGLLASSLAHQIEKDLKPLVPAGKKGGKQVPGSHARSQAALPIALFLVAKLVMYTLLGALLGLLGSFLTFDPITRAILLIAIGIFMIGNALRMFNVHPIFRYFNIEPPQFITRFIRRTSKNSTDVAAPLFLGTLTVFIPCGVTQAMMATALGTGSPAAGALLMFAFTLGTSPVFFAVAYLTTRIGARLEKYFLRFVAVVLLLLGLFSVNSGLNLTGTGFSVDGLLSALAPPPPSSAPVSSDPVTSGGSSEGVILNVQDNGYAPRTLHVKAGQAFTLNLVTNETYSCARDFVIPKLNVYQLLPATGSVAVEIPAQTAGTTIPFTCSMGMYTGQIVVDE